MAGASDRQVRGAAGTGGLSGRSDRNASCERTVRRLRAEPRPRVQGREELATQSAARHHEASDANGKYPPYFRCPGALMTLRITLASIQ